jgi:hypothetical protein
LNPNANEGVGLGPLVLVGGFFDIASSSYVDLGHDTVIIDDSQDTGNNLGNITAFTEKRQGITELVEVGVVSGLGMSLKMIDDNGTEDPVDDIEVTVDGRIEYEGFEVVDLRLSDVGNDTVTIGGGFELDKTLASGGEWDAITKVDTEVTKNRLANDVSDPNSIGIKEIVHSISGMTIVNGGGGEDDIRVLQTQDLEQEASTIVTATETQEGIRGLQEEQVRIDIRADVGFFVLEFADRDLDASSVGGDEAVPGAQQTVVLSNTVTAGELKAALADLRLVGGLDFIDDVSSIAPVGDAKHSFLITFSNQLGNLPDLQVFDTRLLVDGDTGEDVISIQSIDQPTYVLGGDDNDKLNVNVQLSVGGPILGNPPEPLIEQIAQKAVDNGVNDLLTVDGGENGDKYLVYLFGSDINSQINLFDSGASTDDSAIVLGTEASDLFLLRAAVADDGLAFIAMLKPPVVGEVVDVERVNYRGSLDTLDLFGLGGDDAFGIDDARINMNVYGGLGEDFFQVGQLYKSQRTATAGVPNADVFTTIETTRGFLSNGISAPMTIFGGEDNDEFVVYHNLAPLVLNGDAGDDSFLIRAFALVGSQEDLRERTDVSGDAGADLIRYAVNAPVNIDGGDGFDTVIVIGTEFNDDFVITEDGVFGAGLNIQFTRVETVEVDGAEGDDRFFILGTSAGILTKITGGLGSDTFFGNGPTPDVVSNDLLGHSGLITHAVDSSLDPDLSDFSGIKVQGISANVADDDEPAIRIIVSDGSSKVSQVDGLHDTYGIVLTRKPEEGAIVTVTSFAPRGVRFTGDEDGTPSADGKSIALEFTDLNWNTVQTVAFVADQSGDAAMTVLNSGGDDTNAVQVLGMGATEGTFTISSVPSLVDPINELDAFTTAGISFDIRGLTGTELDAALETLRNDIENALNAELQIGVSAVVAKLNKNFTITLNGTGGIVVGELVVDTTNLTANDFVGTVAGFITHDVSIAGEGDTISGKFVQNDVAGQRDGSVNIQIANDSQIDGGDEVQILHFDASDGNFKITLGDQTSEEMLFTPLDPETVRASIDNALNAFTGVTATVNKIGAAGDFSYEITFNGTDGQEVPDLEVDVSNLTKGERTLRVVGALPLFAQGTDYLRGATVKIIDGAGIGQTRLVIFNDATTITVANPWIQPLDETSRIEILRFSGVVMPATLVEIVGDDGKEIDLRETGGGTLAFEAPEVHANGMGFVDEITVSLTSAPSGTVTMEFNSNDDFDNTQLYFEVETFQGSGVFVPLGGLDANELTFVSNELADNAWNKTRTIRVFATDDTLTEGFHKSVLTLTANGGGYVDATSSIVIDIADNEVALAMVIESDGSTNVIETGNAFNSGGVPSDGVSDTYQVILSKAPKPGETVTVGLSADPTRTQRGAGLLGIRAFDPEVVLSNASLIFSHDAMDPNAWFLPQTVTVNAVNDDKVDGGDSKSFPVMFDQANSIEGPLEITGGLSEDRSADLEREPVMLPGETNFKPSIGSVQAVPVGEDGSFSLTIDLDEVIEGETILNTLVNGGTEGVITIATNTNGEPGVSSEVQILTVDAVSGTFKLELPGHGVETSDITYDPTNPTATALDIKAKLEIALGDLVTVEEAGTSFIITFDGPVLAETPLPALVVTNNSLTRKGTEVDDSDKLEQVLTVHGNGGTLRLQLGANPETADIDFSPDNPSVIQSKVIEDELNAVLVGNTAHVSGSGSTYVITFDIDQGSLVVSDETLRVDEVQTLTLNASGGNFKLTLDDNGPNTTGLLSDSILPGALKVALEALPDVGTVDVVKDADSPFYTIIFNDSGDVSTLEAIDSTLTRSVKEALETNLDTTITTPEDLKDFTLEITRGDAKNKFRVIIGGSDPDASPDSQLTVLEISRPWEAGLTDEVPNTGSGSDFTIEKTNRNLLVDENEETDFFFLNDTDNVTSIGELPTAQLIVTADRLTGLGMGGDQMIGDKVIQGGIRYTGLEELIINLGSGDNRIVIADTQPGATTINAGDGNDTFFVESLSGHTFLNASAGADVINVATGLQSLDPQTKASIEEILGVVSIESKQK